MSIDGLDLFIVQLASGQQYRFHAEDEQHAREQAIDAEPDDPPVHVLREGPALPSGIIRDYTLHLRVRVPDSMDMDELDEAVKTIVDASTARDAISDGLYYSDLGDEDDELEVVNLYVLSAERPPGGIEGDGQ